MKPKTSNKMFPNFPKSRILRQATRINKIHGDSETAFKFDPKFSRFDLILPQNRLHKPSIGLRQFWKHNLPTLKFHNYDTEFHVMKVATETDEELTKCPVKLVIHDNEGKKELDCSGFENSEILSKLVEITKASPVPQQELNTLNIEPST